MSDRDTRFTSRFWVELFKMWGTECKFSTTNHPQTNEQTKRVNHMLEEYLRHYVTAALYKLVGASNVKPRKIQNSEE